MAQLSAQQVADVWIAAGGPKSRAVEWTAISLGESSYNTAAVSPDGAIGLWQIMPFNAGPYGYTPADLYNPLVNARVAVAMSGHGTNCAAWDSCYTDIEASGRFTFLAWPQQGSADYNNLQIVAVQLGRDKLGAQVPPKGFNGAPAVAQATANIDAITNKLLPVLGKELIALRMATNIVYRPGWRV